MIRVHFTPHDLARVRLAIHPLGELTEAYEVLRGPAWRQAPFARWTTRARAALADLDVTLLRALLGDGWHAPDFLAPPPDHARPSFEEQLRALSAVDASLVVREVEEALAAGRGHDERLLEPYLSRPREALTGLTHVLEESWTRLFASEWQGVQALLHADVADRALRLAGEGVEALLGSLHPGVSFDQGVLSIRSARHERDVDLEGRGLLLVPSVFQWYGVQWTFVKPWRPMLVYPARGAFRLWQEQPDTPDVAVAVLGRARASLLRILVTPRTTGALARSLRVTPGAVSQQVRVLRGWGLVEDRRVGREVHHLLSERGEAFLCLLDGL